MVQRNAKALKKSVEEGRRWKVEPSTDERNEENNLTRTKGRNPVLARCLPLGEALILDQPVTGQLPQLIFRGGRRGPDLLRSPHGDELLVLNHLEHLLIVHQDLLRIAR
jgi:hypothetical protein